MPRFSIIIPTYNRAHLLPRAVESVVTQTFEDWELIVIDDGSTDNTANVVKPFLTDQRIHYHWQENKELNGARNTGVNQASGEFICFLDDDDLYLPNHLSELNQLITQQDNEKTFYRTGLLIRSSSKEWKSKLYKRGADLPYFLWTESLGITSFAFHRSIFAQYRFAEAYILADDLHFLMQISTAYPLYQAESYPLVYHKHENARTQTYYQQDKLANKLACLEEILHWDSPKLAFLRSDLVRHRLYAEEYLHFARAAFRQKDRLGWFYYRKAISYFIFPLWRSYLLTFLKGFLQLW